MANSRKSRTTRSRKCSSEFSCGLRVSLNITEILLNRAIRYFMNELSENSFVFNNNNLKILWYQISSRLGGSVQSYNMLLRW